MVNAFGLSAAGARLPTQSPPKSNTSAAKNIVYTSEKSTAPEKSTSEDQPKSGKMSAWKSISKKDETVKRAPSVASTSTEAPLLDRNGRRVQNYNTAEMMRGQFRFTSG